MSFFYFNSEFYKCSKWKNISREETYLVSTQVPVLTNITNVYAANLECVNATNVPLGNFSVSEIQSTQASRASSVLPLRSRRGWLKIFEVPTAKQSTLLFKTFNDPLCNLKPAEIKELINVFFTYILEITGLYPSSCQYLLVKKYRHLEQINGKNGRVSF